MAALLRQGRQQRQAEAKAVAAKLKAKAAAAAAAEAAAKAEAKAQAAEAANVPSWQEVEARSRGKRWSLRWDLTFDVCGQVSVCVYSSEFRTVNSEL